MQAYENPLLTLAFEADVDLDRGELVKLNSDTEAAKAGDGEAIIGVVRKDVSAGETAEIVVAGVAVALAGGIFNAGTILAPNASSRAVTAAAGEYPGLTALQASAADGNYVAVLVNPGQVVIPTP